MLAGFYSALTVHFRHLLKTVISLTFFFCHKLEGTYHQSSQLKSEISQTPKPIRPASAPSMVYPMIVVDVHPITRRSRFHFPSPRQRSSVGWLVVMFVFIPKFRTQLAQLRPSQYHSFPLLFTSKNAPSPSPPPITTKKRGS